MENKSQKYESPRIDILEIEIEKGFAVSLPDTGLLPDWNDGGSLTSINNFLLNE